MKDIYSRKLVMNEVWEEESAEHASVLLAKGCLREGIAGRPLVLHSDNGSAMKGATMRAAMIDLGVQPSFSRPRVSNDNAFAESLFRTAKYCALWPEKPFEHAPGGSGVGAAFRAVVQRRALPQRAEVCQSGTTASRRSARSAGPTACAIREGAHAESGNAGQAPFATGIWRTRSI